MAVQIGSYKGKPTISLGAETKWPFTFGVAKAQMILANLDAIRGFVAKYSAPAGASSGPDRVDMAYEDRCAEQCGLNGGAR
jgi:hypothetical protein